MGGGNDGGSSDEEEEDDGEHGVDSADERSKVRGWLSDRSIAIDRTCYCSVLACARDPPLLSEGQILGRTFAVFVLALLLT